MESLFFGSFLILGALIGILLFADYLERVASTMEERKAIIFEIYRYAICFLMVIVFGLSAFQLAGALIGDASNPQALTPPGLSAIISGIFFLVHWFIKNPVQPKASP